MQGALLQGLAQKQLQARQTTPEGPHRADLYASEMVTASGKPSGTATTTMVTAKMKNASGPDAICATGNPRFCTHHLHAC